MTSFKIANVLREMAVEINGWGGVGQRLRNVRRKCHAHCAVRTRDGQVSGVL